MGEFTMPTSSQRTIRLADHSSCPIPAEPTHVAIGTKFARKLFNKRAAICGRVISGITLQDLLGRSDLLDPKDEEWDMASHPMRLLKEFCNARTVDRALKLSR
jgi:hypothetical protein